MSLPHESKPELKPCLKDFEHINRYWDRHQKYYVAKILPGEFYVTKNDEYIATTLGSCVSACIWDEKAGIGGMNHFMLPLTDADSDKVLWGNVASDATRYGNYAMEHLINELLKNGARREYLKSKVFGGAKVLQQGVDIGGKNSDFVIEYLSMENVPILAEDLRDNYPRKLIFNPIEGKVLMKRLHLLNNNTINTREDRYREKLTQEKVEGEVDLF